MSDSSFPGNTYNGRPGVRLSRQMLNDLQGFSQAHDAQRPVATGPSQASDSQPCPTNWHTAAHPAPHRSPAPRPTSIHLPQNPHNPYAPRAAYGAGLMNWTPQSSPGTDDGSACCRGSPAGDYFEWRPDYRCLKAVTDWLHSDDETDPPAAPSAELTTAMDPDSAPTNPRVSPEAQPRHIPVEIIGNICQFLSPVQLSTTAAVNWSWYYASLNVLKKNLSAQIDQLQVTLHQQHNVTSLYCNLYQRQHVRQSPTYMAEAIRIFSASEHLASPPDPYSLGDDDAFPTPARLFAPDNTADMPARVILRTSNYEFDLPYADPAPVDGFLRFMPPLYPHPHFPYYAHHEPAGLAYPGDASRKQVTRGPTTSDVNRTITWYLYQLHESSLHDTPAAERLHNLQIQTCLGYLGYILSVFLPDILRQRLRKLGEITESINPKWLAGCH
ncbi:hypothetical protein IWQ60_002529 [Tieghemiomyces parasiticus]|uniref:F-box domain-containing protein n=1 Tax=Tieghemiomyces parasiticus TaxID=78921 RepID=A0A9W8E1K2_9FUNG|nr:hypothetical protein IWQ60_002529 [Tieghemiomyces parasiticus]